MTDPTLLRRRGLHIPRPTPGASPTPDAYQAACDAIDKHRGRADAAEAAIQRVRDLCAAVGPGAVYTIDVLAALNDPEAGR